MLAIEHFLNFIYIYNIWIAAFIKTNVVYTYSAQS